MLFLQTQKNDICMKILQLINNLGSGGAEKLISEYVPELISNGHSVEILIIRKLNSVYIDELERKNIVVNSLTDKYLYNPIVLFKLLLFLNNRKYDIIHVHLFPSLYWVSIAKIISFSKTKLIFTEHSTFNNRRNSKLFKFIDRFIYKKYSKIITISDATTINLKKHLGCKFSYNIKTVYNGVDLKSFNTNLNPKYKDTNKFILLQVASFRNAKDQDTVIRALKNLPKNIELVFVGDGERINRCKTLSNYLELNDRISFLGFQKNIQELITQCDCLIMSSKYEGFGKAAVEGMACSKPVVATNVEGLSDIVNGYGLLFDVGDEKKLSEHILNLYNNKVFYEKIAKNCLIRSKDFDIQQMISKYEEIYMEVLSE